MKADTLNAKDLFEKSVRYVIPAFQRPYVWQQDEQWEPFWVDVETAAERYLDALRDEDGNAARAEKQAGRHFLGAVVLQQEFTGSSEIDTRNVIDGQQRLTTLQLLLDAAEEAAREAGWDDLAEGLEDLVLNKARYARRDPDFRFKLWPTATDRDAFRAVMMDDADSTSFASSQIARAHEYFKLRITDWVRRGDDERERTAALETALVGLLELVVIDLGADDDAYVIFETLNARGTPLRPSDLIKNYIMQTVDLTGGDVEEVHRCSWIQFEENTWWQQDVRQGRLHRPRIDMFLDYWLEMTTGVEVASHALFQDFQRYVEAGDQPIDTLVGDIKSAGLAYEAIFDFDARSPEGTFVYRWRTLDVGVLTPLVLWLFMHRDKELSVERFRTCLNVLESFLIRRMLCRGTTKDYNRLFLDVLERLLAGDTALADEVLTEVLKRQEADSRLWPTDSEVATSLVDLPVYRLLTRQRLRMILEALDDHMRGPKTEVPFVERAKLTIEHAMPQSWEANWPLPTDDDPVEATGRRNRLLHSIGNLTLVTRSLNPALSNAAWTVKHPALDKFTASFLNRELVNSSANGWAESDIVERSQLLAERICKVWPHP